MAALSYIEALFIAAESNTDAVNRSGLTTYSISGALKHLETRLNQGIRSFLLFGSTLQDPIPPLPEAIAPVCRLIRAAKAAFADQVELIADVGLSPYQRTGHSVVMRADGTIDHDASYRACAELAVAASDAGCDWVAPCLSLPDQVSYLNLALSGKAAAANIMPYSVKFSSTLYGPYRDAVNSPQKSNRKPYQTDFSDPATALSQLERDIAGGVERAIVKPSLHYLDVLQTACSRAAIPLAAFHVSGEYAMARQAIAAGLLESAGYYNELFSAYQRCGARWVIGYAADEYLNWRRSSNLNG